MPKFVSFDVESHRIKPGMVCPKLVCLSHAEGGNVDLIDRPAGVEWLRDQLESDVYLIGHNIPYDLSVVAAEDPEWFLPRIFAAYEAGRIYDTIIRQNLIDIAKGEHKFRGETKTAYGLDVLVKLHLDIDLPKTGDTPADPGYWRLRYGSLDGVPISMWPAPARQYAEDDARWTSRLWARMFEDEAFDIPNEIEQNQASWALRLAGIWGLRTDAAATASYRAELEREILNATVALKKLGFVRPKGTRDMEAIRAAVTAACVKQDRAAKKTNKGAVATSKALLKEMGDPDLKVLADSAETRTNFTRYLPMLELGTEHPMNPGWVTCVETGRVACREPNIMNPPRKGKVRECIRPRDGYWFATCDYDAAELRSWAQVCLDLLGVSSMAEALRKGEDLHVRLGAEILGISFAEAQSRYHAGDSEVADVRQTAKKCYHPDTEVLTRNGWKKIGDLVPGEEVMQAFPDREGVRLSWTIPLQLVRLRHESKKLVRLRNEGIDIRVTPDHRMLIYRANGNYDVVTPAEFPTARNWANAGVLRETTVRMADELLRLAVATQADGSIAKGSKQLRFGFHKQRKIDRMDEILQNFPLTDWTRKERLRPPLGGYTEPYRVVEYVVKAKTAYRVRNVLDGKSFSWSWLGLSREQRELMLEEIKYWDGHQGKRSIAHRYSSTDRQSVDIVQAVAAITGRKTRAVWRQPTGVNNRLIGNLTIRSRWDTRGESVKITEERFTDEVVCLSVPSSFVLVRDGGVPLICGQCNFGLPGGMGAERLRASFKDDGVGISIEQAKEIKDAWLRTWVEARMYLDHIGRLVGDSDASTIRQVRSGRIRGQVGYSDAANSFFQGLTADGAKAALWAVSRECYTVKDSPLYGSRVVIFLHDELIIEVPITRSSAAAKRLQEVMCAEMQKWLPDVPVTATAVLMKKWTKGCKPVRDATGNLLPSRAEKHGDKTVWVADV